jgi:uncharacterized phage protein (TIGR01671 family)
MERIIEFRGKSINSDSWAYGCLFCDENGKTYIVHELFKSPVYVQVFPESIGQFTGAVDKKGNKIYEGDIIRETIEVDDCDEVIYYVCKYFPINCSFVWMSYGDTMTDWLFSEEEYPTNVGNGFHTIINNEFDKSIKEYQDEWEEQRLREED